jgi:hypothetical protein
MEDHGFWEDKGSVNNSVSTMWDYTHHLNSAMGGSIAIHEIHDTALHHNCLSGQTNQ